jgi:hypothetical protein
MSGPTPSPSPNSSNLGRGISPAVGTRITGEGSVVFHDVTFYGLHRMCVATQGKYPDVNTWMEMLKEVHVMRTRYTEKMTVGVFTGYLWFYWKEVGEK